MADIPITMKSSWRVRRIITRCAPVLLLMACMPFAHCTEKTSPNKSSSNQPKDPAVPAPTGDKRILFAQIVEDDEPREYTECAILEGQPYKYFLKAIAASSHDEVKKLTNDELTFDRLINNPGLFRGQVVTLARGVVLEVAQAKLTPEYGLPGYTVLIGIFIDSARDVYAFRILSPPGSKVYEKLRNGIDNDAYPVARLTGYFMKVNARKTADPHEPPWRRPLLICPEPEFAKIVEPRKVNRELEESKASRLLPSERIEGPGAEERLIVEVLPEAEGSAKWIVRAHGHEMHGDLKIFIKQEVDALCERLPEEQKKYPSAVVLMGAGAPRTPLQDILMALRGAGVERLFLKNEQ